MKRRKITHLTRKLKTSRETWDDNGERVQEKVIKEVKRQVKVVPSANRIFHFIIDLIVYRLIVTVAIILFNFVDYGFYKDSFLNLIIYNVSIFFFLGYPVYYFVFEYFWQRTPGKLITRGHVIDEYAETPSLKSTLLRSITRLVPFEQVSCLISDRGWHDKWSNTYVVTKEELKKLHGLMAMVEKEKSKQEL